MYNTITNINISIGKIMQHQYVCTYNFSLILQLKRFHCVVDAFICDTIDDNAQYTNAYQQVECALS